MTTHTFLRIEVPLIKGDTLIAFCLGLYLYTIMLKGWGILSILNPVGLSKISGHYINKLAVVHTSKLKVGPRGSPCIYNYCSILL